MPSDRILDDAQIMQRVSGGEFALFDQLVVRYRPALLRVAWSKLGDATRAEDIVQEAFLAAFAARKTFNPQFAFRTWLWTILLNLCRRQMKKQSAWPREYVRSEIGAQHQAALPEPASHDSALQAVLVEERNEQLQRLLDRLSDVQADAIRLRFFGGLKFEEIAQTMQCSLSAAKVRVRTGLQKLAEQLPDAEGDSR